MVSLLLADPATAIAQAPEDLRLPKRVESGVKTIPLRRREVRPNAVVRPPASPVAERLKENQAGLGAGHMSWRLFKPDGDGVAEVAGEEASPPVLRTTAAELIRGIVLLPGETALELTGVEPGLVVGLGESAKGDGDGGNRARAEALRRQIETYTNGVRVAAAFEGIRDHGTRPPRETVASLESLLGTPADDRIERGIAEAVILGFAAAGRIIDDVIVVKDDTAPGIFKVVVLGGKADSGVSVGE